MQDVAKQFGIKVRAARKALGLSQDQLALMANLDRSYMGRIERGEVNITLERIYRIAKVLNCSAKDLIP